MTTQLPITTQHKPVQPSAGCHQQSLAGYPLEGGEDPKYSECGDEESDDGELWEELAPDAAQFLESEVFGEDDAQLFRRHISRVNGGEHLHNDRSVARRRLRKA